MKRSIFIFVLAALAAHAETKEEEQKRDVLENTCFAAFRAERVLKLAKREKKGTDGARRMYELLRTRIFDLEVQTESYESFWEKKFNEKVCKGQVFDGPAAEEL